MNHDLHLGQPTVLRHSVLLCVSWMSGEYTVWSWKGLSAAVLQGLYT